jgi:hypothetical protein
MHLTAKGKIALQGATHDPVILVLSIVHGGETRLVERKKIFVSAR